MYSLLTDYTKYFDEAVNQGLRTGVMSEKCDRIVKAITQAIDESSPTTKAMTLFRGVKSTKEFNIRDMNVGDFLYDPGFSSKSGKEHPAFNFAGDYCCVLVVEYPVGSKLLSMKEYSLFPEEDEYLTYPGEVLEIVKTSKNYRNMKILTVKPIEYRPKQYIIDKNIDLNYRKFKKEVLKHKNIFFPNINFMISETPHNVDLIVNAEGAFTVDLDKYSYKSLDMKTKKTKEFGAKLYSMFVTGKLDEGYYGPPWKMLK